MKRKQVHPRSKMHKKRVKTNSRHPKGGKKGHLQAVTLINEQLSQLENQALKAYECIQAIKKRSTPHWKEWIGKLSREDWSALANAQRDRITSEVKNLSDEILSKIHNADILDGKDGLVKEAKLNLEELVKKLHQSRLVEHAIDTAIHTKDGLLAFLNIPTHEEMARLQKQLKRLEHRIGEIREKRHH